MNTPNPTPKPESDDYERKYEMLGIPSENWQLTREMEVQEMRDRFATAALTGLLGMQMAVFPSNLAHDAYRIADAMLAERDKR